MYGLQKLDIRSITSTKATHECVQYLRMHDRRPYPRAILEHRSQTSSGNGESHRYAAGEHERARKRESFSTWLALVSGGVRDVRGWVWRSHKNGCFVAIAEASSSVQIITSRASSLDCKV